MRKTFATAVLLSLLALPLTASYAQKADGAKAVTVLVCIGKNSEYSVGDADPVSIKSGMQIPETAMVRVNSRNDMLELELPDGSTLNVYGLTTISLSALNRKSASGKNENLIQLIMGKIFAKVQKTDNQDFRIETATGVAAVRGTKFGVSYSPGAGGRVGVTEGRVEVLDPAGAFQPVMVDPGFQTTIPGDTGGNPVAPFAMTAADNRFFDQSYAAPVDAASSAPGGTPANTGNTGSTGAIDAGSVPGGMGSGLSPSASPAQKKAEGSCTKEGFNWSISTETIGASVWNKVLLSPTFKAGDLTLGLYLTMYFQTLEDTIDPRKWYNWNEWNFGLSTNTNAAWEPLDLLHDTLLKLRFLQYKTKEMLIGVGSLPSMSIGHGSLVNNYANDLEFPSRRVIGAQFGWDLGNFGLEIMTGDVFQLRLLSGRAFVRPLFATNGTFLIKNLAIGVSGFVDLNPAQGASNVMFNIGSTNKAFGYAIDFDLPFIDILGVTSTFYGDLATLGWTSQLDPSVYPTNYPPAFMLSNSYMKGYGLFAGIKGTALVFDYRAEYRYIRGGFIPNYVDKFYDLMAVSNFQTLVNKGNTNNFNGFLFEAGKNFDNIGGVTLSYQEYFADNVPSATNHNNFLHFEAYIDKCLAKNMNLPVKGYASVAFDKSHFDWADFTVWNNLLNNGVLTAKLFYQPSDGVAIGTTYRKFYSVKADGSLKEESTITLETQMGL